MREIRTSGLMSGIWKRNGLALPRQISTLRRLHRLFLSFQQEMLGGYWIVSSKVSANQRFKIVMALGGDIHLWSGVDRLTSRSRFSRADVVCSSKPIR
jgi:hypothetical protein